MVSQLLIIEYCITQGAPPGVLGTDEIKQKLLKVPTIQK